MSTLTAWTTGAPRSVAMCMPVWSQRTLPLAAITRWSSRWSVPSAIALRSESRKLSRSAGCTISSQKFGVAVHRARGWPSICSARELT